MPLNRHSANSSAECWESAVLSVRESNSQDLGSDVLNRFPLIVILRGLLLEINETQFHYR